MQKRGQVTVFVIVGIVAIITIALIFFAKDALIEQATKATNNEKYLQLQATSIQNEIRTCAETITQETLTTLGNQGGYFDPPKFISYYNKKIGYRCTQREDIEACQNDPIVQTTFKNKIEQHITTQMQSCLDLTRWRNKEFIMETGELQTELTLHEASTQVDITYPLTLTKNDVTITRDKTTTHLPVPLQTITDKTNDITNKEAAGTKVDPLEESMTSGGKYSVEVIKPYPHRIYKITANNYEWLFAIEGEGRYGSAY